MALPTAIRAIKDEMKARGLKQSDMTPFFGTRARASEILNRRRALSIGMIRKLHFGLGIDAAKLIKSYPLKQS